MQFPASFQSRKVYRVFGRSHPGSKRAETRYADSAGADDPAAGEDCTGVHRDDPELVEACLRGEQRAWDALVEKYGRLVYSIPRKLRFTDSDAEDIFQTVFSITLRNLAALRDQTRLSAWLIRTTYRECWRERKKVRATIEFGTDIASSGAPSEEQVFALERQQLVREALAQIDGRCRTLLEALFFEPNTKSYDELAAQLGVAIGSIGPTRARCFQKLRTILEDFGFEY
jgi:RNA polymerase sigma factor (sigma-70 family)